MSILNSTHVLECTQVKKHPATKDAAAWYEFVFTKDNMKFSVPGDSNVDFMVDDQVAVSLEMRNKPKQKKVDEF